MIYVDADVFLRHLVQPVTPNGVSDARIATALLHDAEHKREVITTSDAVVAEVVFILSHRQHYGYPRAQVASAVADLLRISGLRLPNERACVRAVELWESAAKPSFPDALGAAYSEIEGYALATFDRARATLPTITPHAWST